MIDLVNMILQIIVALSADDQKDSSISLMFACVDE